MEPFLIPLPSRMRPDDVAYLKSRGALAIPNTKLRNALLRSYFTHIHPFMPVIDMDEFLRAIESDGRYHRISFLLFQAVMFAGAACIPMCYLEKLGFNSRKEAREDLFARVRLLYDFDYETDRLALVQSLLLMTLWYKSPEEHRNTWHWLDVAVSQAFAIGLHVESDKAISSRRQCSLRRKIWWSCYVTDRLISLHMKRPPRIRGDDFHVAVLQESDFQAKLPSQDRHVLLQAMCPYVSDTELRSTLGRLFIELAGLCQLMDPMLRLHRSARLDENKILPFGDRGMTNSPNPSLDSIQKLSVLKTRLTEWMDSLQKACSYKASTSTEFASVIYLHQTILCLTFQAMMLNTYRSTKIISQEQSDYIEAEEAKSDMVGAAKQISNLAGEVLEKGLCNFLPASTLGGIVHAAAIFLQRAEYQEQAEKEDSEERLMQCLEVITLMEEIYEPARMAKEAISWALLRPWHLRELSNIDITQAEDILVHHSETPYSKREYSSPDNCTGRDAETNTPSTATSLWSSDLDHREELGPVLKAWGFIAKEEPMIANVDAEIHGLSMISMEGLGVLNDLTLSMEFRKLSSDICSQ
ncbi:cutinase transcription factor 1 beta [Fusarium beomiforme]|uniref:Cutinase transcription factor 1 beta n=1 Tax=Fusarium beomiforme TaxID=44412 RepID=A0A9P5AL28_9HYPO|nr:cutinase transcription factor 1 beta [Fusarium beomiforme]